MVKDKNSVLKLDFDTKSFALVLREFTRAKYLNWRVFGAQNVRCCKTARGFHVQVFCGRHFEFKELVFFQALMGSDKNREYLNWCRAKNGLNEKWNYLFVKKYKIVGRGKAFKVSEEKYLSKESRLLFLALQKKGG